MIEQIRNCNHRGGEVTKFKEFKLLSINVNSIVSNVRRYNLLDTLLKLKIDIALINETKLKDRHKLKFPDYNIVRDDRASGKGGDGHNNK